MIFNKNISQKTLSKTFGINSDREGIITRYLSEKNNWEAHLQNSKQYILDASKTKDKNIAVILGSGWWLDIPYKELSEIFHKLYFIDISHPNQIIHKAKKYPNIELITADISGTLKLVYEIKKHKKEFNINNFNIDVNNFGIPKEIKPDFIVSLNLLNQLSYFPKHYLLKHEVISKKEVKIIVEKIEQSHLNNLQKNKSCIIADFYQYEYSFDNILQKEFKRTTVNIPVNSTRKEWIWDFDLSGNFINNKKIKFKVAALQV